MAARRRASFQLQADEARSALRRRRHRRKRAHFRNKCVACFTSIIKRGEEGEVDMWSCIDSFLQFIERHNPDVHSDDEGDEAGAAGDADVDTLDQAIDCVVSTGKALRLLVLLGREELRWAHFQLLTTWPLF